MLWEIFDWETLKPLAIEQEGSSRYEIPRHASFAFFRGLEAKYGNVGYRPYVDPADFRHRNPVREEVVPGFVCLMVENVHEKAGHWNSPYGTFVKVDEVKDVQSPYDRDKIIPYVFYHCVYPKWHGQCFVPMDDFLNKPHLQCGGSDRRYWVDPDIQVKLQHLGI